MALPHPIVTFDLSHDTVSLSVCLRSFVLTNVTKKQEQQHFRVDEIGVDEIQYPWISQRKKTQL